MLVQATLRAISLPAPALESSFYFIGSSSISLARLVIGYVARKLIRIVLRPLEVALRIGAALIIIVPAWANITQRFAASLVHLMIRTTDSTAAAHASLRTFEDRC